MLLPETNFASGQLTSTCSSGGQAVPETVSYVMLLRRLVLRSLMQQQQNCHNHMVSVSRGHPAVGVKMTDRGGAMTDISLQENASDFDNRLRQLEDAQSARRPDPYGYAPR